MAGIEAQYRSLLETAGLISADHELVWVTGKDTVSFLDGLLSQDVAGMAPGTVAGSLLLTPQGKLRATMWVLRDRERCGLLTERGAAARVVADLARFQIRVEVAFGAARPMSSLCGPSARELLAGAGVGLDSGWLEADGAVAIAAPLRGLDRWFVSSELDGTLAAAGAVPVGEVVATALRIEGGIPRWGVDVDDSTIPQEAGVVAGAVSFGKGCYLGQELVARIDSRGRVNRHLRGLVVGGDEIPLPGARVVAGGADMGTVTSVAVSPRLGVPVALAVLRREVGPGDAVFLQWEDGSAAAVVHELPLDDALAAKSG